MAAKELAEETSGLVEALSEAIFKCLLITSIISLSVICAIERTP